MSLKPHPVPMIPKTTRHVAQAVSSQPAPAMRFRDDDPGNRPRAIWEGLGISRATYYRTLKKNAKKNE